MKQYISASHPPHKKKQRSKAIFDAVKDKEDKYRTIFCSLCAHEQQRHADSIAAEILAACSFTTNVKKNLQVAADFQILIDLIIFKLQKEIQVMLNSDKVNSITPSNQDFEGEFETPFLISQKTRLF